MLLLTLLPTHGSSQTFQGVPTIIEEDQDGLKRIHSTLNAASAAEMLQKLELDTVMLSEWYKLSDDQGRKNFENSNASKRDSMDDFSDLSTQDAIKEGNNATVSAATTVKPCTRLESLSAIRTLTFECTPRVDRLNLNCHQLPTQTVLPLTTRRISKATSSAFRTPKRKRRKRKEKERWSQYPQYTKKGVGKNGTRYQNGDKSKEETTKVLTGFQPANKIVPRVV